MYEGNVNIIIPAIISAITFIACALIGKFFLSAKERKDVCSADASNSQRLEDALEISHKEYRTALTKICDKKRKNEEITYSDYGNINNAAEAYFKDLRALCNSIMARNLLHKNWKHDHISKVKIEIIEEHYSVLHKIEVILGISEGQKFNKEEYTSVYQVYHLHNNPSKWKQRYYAIRRFFKMR